jgi:hypothetical protein
LFFKNLFVLTLNASSETTTTTTTTATAAASNPPELGQSHYSPSSPAASQLIVVGFLKVLTG